MIWLWNDNMRSNVQYCFYMLPTTENELYMYSLKKLHVKIIYSNHYFIQSHKVRGEQTVRML